MKTLRFTPPIINVPSKELDRSTWLLRSFLMVAILAVGTTHLARGQQGGQPNPLELIGSWTFQQGPSFARITPEFKERLDDDPQLKSNVFAGYIDRIMTFNANGTFSQRIGSGAEMNGTWQLQDDVLTITDASGNLWIQQVNRLDQNQLILDQGDQGEAKPVIPQLYFFKN